MPKTPVSLAGAQILGAGSAKAALIVYSDFQCPFCANFASQAFTDLKKQYVDTGKLRVAFRNFPLENIHPFALEAAQIGMCAAKSNGFWAAHDQIFENQKELSEAKLRNVAASLGFTPPKLAQCLSDRSVLAALQIEAATARSLGVKSTPTFFIGALQDDGSVIVSERITGAAAATRFHIAIDKIVSPS